MNIGCVKKKCYWVLLNIIFWQSPVFSETDDLITEESGNPAYLRIFDGTILPKELTEGILMGGLIVTDQFLKKQQAWFDEPWMPSKLDRPGSYNISEDLIPIAWINLAGIIPNVGIFLLPNDKGFYNSISYRHAKGFSEAVYIVTPFFTDLAKLSFGKKRPNYHALNADGTEPVGARKSFWSLHAATSFSISTYSSLYLFQHYGGSWGENLEWKIPISLSLFGVSTLVWLSRDYNLDHDDVDLVTGASFGTLTSLIIYAVHEGWIFNFYKPTVNSSLLPGPNSLKYTYNF